MYKVTKQMRTETGHRLMDYDGKCSHLHGHSYLWEVTAASFKLDDKGMVLDFKDLKAAMKMYIEPFDHAMVLKSDDPLARMLGQAPATNGAEQRVILVAKNPTAEFFAEYAYDKLNDYFFDQDFQINNVRVWETASSFAEHARVI